MNKKFLWIALAFLMGVSPVYGASQWTKTGPAGTSLMADLDTAIATVNNEALDRLQSNYRRDCTVIPDSVSTVKVLSGEIAVPNSDGSVIRWRKNTATTTVAWTNIDAGSESSSTQYYVWAIADADATTFTVKISTNATTPTGATYYRLLGYFYNDSSSNIVSVGNIKGGDVSNAIQVTASDAVVSAGDSAYHDMPDMVIYFVSSGRPIDINFGATFGVVAASVYANIIIDGSEVIHQGVITTGNQTPCSIPYLATNIAAGTHTIKAQWRANGAVQQSGVSNGGYIDGARVLIAKEL